jgi:hypothetical protein
VGFEHKAALERLNCHRALCRSKVGGWILHGAPSVLITAPTPATLPHFIPSRGQIVCTLQANKYVIPLIDEVTGVLDLDFKPVDMND